MRSRIQLAACALAACLAWCGPMQAGLLTTVTADFDVHRHAGAGPYDGGPALRVGTVGNPNNDQRAFIHFDLNDLAGPSGDISEATFRVRFTGTEDQYGNAYLREITSSWAAATVPYAQPVGPQIGGGFLPDTPVADTYYEVDVTSELQAWQTGGANSADFHGFSIRGAEGYTLTFKDFNSEESGLGPELVIVTAPVPDGGTIAVTPDVDLYVDKVTSGSTFTYTTVDNTHLDLGHNAGGNTGEDDRALMKYDLSALAGATVLSATLALDQVEQGTADQHGFAQLRRINASDWDGTEASTFLYDLVAPTDSTFITNFSPATNPPPGLYSLDVTSVVQGWISGATPNYGFGLKQGSEGFGGTGRRFTHRPVLTIEYEFPTVPIPEPATMCALGMALAGLGGYIRKRRRA